MIDQCAVNSTKHYLGILEALAIYTQYRYNDSMIKTFRDKETERIYQQEFSQKLPHSIQKLALRKLIMIDNAENINDLRVPPSNHLERLADKKGKHFSIWINNP